MTRWLAALLIVVLGSVEFPEPGDLTITPEGCVVDRDGREECPATCETCSTDAECEALCPDLEEE